MSYKDSRLEYGLDQIETFLRAVDRHLLAATKIVVIGGGAIAFHHGGSTTEDIDTCSMTEEFVRASELAAAETALRIPVSQPGVAEFPYNFEDRLERRLPELEKLEVWVLERHDLALSKVVRGDRHDEQRIQGMHDASPLDFDVLVERFRTEMKYTTGDQARIRRQFLELVELLFGELKRVAAERALLKKGGAGQS